MSKEQSNPLLNTVETIFSGSDTWFNQTTHPKLKTLKPAQKKELELALTILLVDLASSDQSFDQQEYLIIAGGLRRMFGTSRDQVKSLVNQATLVLKNLRGNAKFGELLRDNLELTQKEVIMEIIEEIICSDGKEDGFEIYLRHKLAGLLGITISERKPNDIN